MTPPFRSWAEDYPHPDRLAFGPINREAVANVMRNRGRIRGIANSASNHPLKGAARLIMSGHDENERRAADPAERARLHLQRRGDSVFRANVVGGRKDRWCVNRASQHLTDAELIALAERHGFTAKQKDHANGRR